MSVCVPVRSMKNTAEFAELVKSIEEQGQIEPIVMLGGQVFDGLKVKKDREAGKFVAV